MSEVEVKSKLKLILCKIRVQYKVKVAKTTNSLNKHTLTKKKKFASYKNDENSRPRNRE